MPAAVESERIVLGAILTHETHHGQAAQLLRPDDFSLDSYRRLFRLFTEMREADTPIDLATVCEELKKRKLVEAVGGIAGVASLTDGAIPQRAHIEHHARKIRDCSHRRGFVHALDAAKARTLADEKLPEVCSDLMQSVLEYGNNTGRRRKLLISAPDFLAQAPEEIDWLVKGVIERGANGFFSAVPKGGKSWAAIDLALSLALGCDWLGFKVPQPVKTVLVSREDNPSLTAWRLRHLKAGKPYHDAGLLDANLKLNTRNQSADLMLDNREHMLELMASLTEFRPAFAIFDVFNVMHAADENDNQEMRAVLRQLSAIQAEVGCGIGVVHHFNKSDSGSMTQRLRGSSAIAGWAEWMVGISLADEESKTRRMEFELKAAQPPDPIYFRIDSAVDSNPARAHGSTCGGTATGRISGQVHEELR